MTWIKTENAKFKKEEVVAFQYLPDNYSRTDPEFLIILRGGGNMRFIGEEATRLWERFKNESEDFG